MSPFQPTADTIVLNAGSAPMRPGTYRVVNDSDATVMLTIGDHSGMPLIPSAIEILTIPSSGASLGPTLVTADGGPVYFTPGVGV